MILEFVDTYQQVVGPFAAKAERIVKYLVEEVYGFGQTQLAGSFKNGLFLPSSDLNLVVDCNSVLNPKKGAAQNAKSGSRQLSVTPENKENSLKNRIDQFFQEILRLCPGSSIVKRTIRQGNEKSITLKIVLPKPPRQPVSEPNILWGRNAQVLKKHLGFPKQDLSTVLEQVRKKVNCPENDPPTQSTRSAQKDKNYSLFSKRSKTKKHSLPHKDRLSKTHSVLEDVVNCLANLLTFNSEDMLSIPIEVMFKWNSTKEIPRASDFKGYMQRYPRLRPLYLLFKVLLRRMGFVTESASTGLSSLSIFLMVLSFVQKEEFSSFQTNPQYFLAYNDVDRFGFKSLHEIPYVSSGKETLEPKSGILSQGKSFKISSVNQFPSSDQNSLAFFPDLNGPGLRSQKTPPLADLKKGASRKRNSGSESLKSSNPLLGNQLYQTPNQHPQGESNSKHPQPKKVVVSKTKKKLSMFSNSFAHPSINSSPPTKDAPKPKPKMSSFQMKLKNKLKRSKKAHNFQVKNNLNTSHSRNTPSSSQNATPKPGQLKATLPDESGQDLLLERQNGQRTEKSLVASRLLLLLQFYSEFLYESYVIRPQLEFHVPCFPYVQKTEQASPELRVVSPSNNKFVTTQAFDRTQELKAKLKLVYTSFYFQPTPESLKSGKTYTLEYTTLAWRNSQRADTQASLYSSKEKSHSTLHTKTFSGGPDQKGAFYRETSKTETPTTKANPKSRHRPDPSHTKTSLRSLKNPQNQDLVRTSFEIEHDNHASAQNPTKNRAGFKVELKSPPIISQSKSRPSEALKKKGPPSKTSLKSKYSSLKTIHHKQKSATKMDTMRSYESIRSMKERAFQLTQDTASKKQRQDHKYSKKKASRSNALLSNLESKSVKNPDAGLGKAKKSLADTARKEETAQKPKTVRSQFKFLHLFNEKQLAGFRSVIPEETLQELGKRKEAQVQPGVGVNKLSSILQSWEKMLMK